MKTLSEQVHKDFGADCDFRYRSARVQFDDAGCATLIRNWGGEVHG